MSDHEWCRDVRRDEAIRAAEDAAAVPAIQHRDLPEVVAALTERVARLEAAQATLGSGDVYADVGCGSTGDEIARLTAERDAAIRERDEAQSEAAGLRSRLEAESAPGLRSLANNLRDKLRSCESALKRVEGERDAALADVAALQRERDDALLVLPACCGRLSDAAATVVQERDAAREEFERLRHLLKTKESECETHHPWVHPSAAPAANAGGVSNPGDVSGDGKSNCQGTLDGSQEPMAWGVMVGGKIDRHAGSDALFIAKDEADDWCGAVSLCGRGTVVPLYDAQQPPRGWLTADERALIESLRATFEQNADALRTHGLGGHVDNWERRVRLLDAILARETPPKVKVPTWIHDDVRSCVIAAIRAAGGEVEG